MLTDKAQAKAAFAASCGIFLLWGSKERLMLLNVLDYKTKGEKSEIERSVEHMVKQLFAELAELPEVEAIALGGSRATDHYDEKSDYDLYLYCTNGISEEIRGDILSKYCGRMEIGNHFWEYEDNGTLNDGVDIDILYRDLDALSADVASVVEQYQARNGYTTCMWHNLMTCKVIVDKGGRLEAARKRFDVPYPERLKRNIIDRNMKLLHRAMPAYEAQIAKAVNRGDLVSVNHRTAAFMESYFDVIFAVNELTHPGEKRLVRLCRENCGILPARFEENLDQLFGDLFLRKSAVAADLLQIIEQLEKIVPHFS